VPTTPCIAQVRIDFHPDRPIDVIADAPETSSDGGLLLVRQADDRLGLCQRLASRLPDQRDPDRIEHSREEQLRQRVLQIALGYEDCNDADRLRHDPLFKTACDRAPDGPPLSSQPTLSRFENVADGRAIKAMIADLEQSYVDGLPADTNLVVLDIDPTDDETHGRQQLTFFHGFYDQHMYHPLLVFDGQSGQLVSVLLRPGNAHAARGAKSLLTRIIRRIKVRFPSAQILVRADSGFCVPRILDQLEALKRELGDIHYVLGLAKNPRLLALAEEAIAEARRRYEMTRRHVRHFTAIQYAAATWSHERRVVAKAEHHHKGANPRFVVTDLDDVEPQLVYDVIYCARGQAENMIKDLKNALNADRLSCSRYVANFFRLLLHATAYRLMHAIRTAAATVAPDLATKQFDTLRLRLLKVAAHVTQSARRILVRLPRVFPLAEAFCRISHFLVQIPPPQAPS
jgi:hypothetical protein